MKEIKIILTDGTVLKCVVHSKSDVEKIAKQYDNWEWSND